MIRSFLSIFLSTLAGVALGLRVCSLHSTMSMVDSITPGCIIGGGRIGSFLYDSNGGKDILIASRSQSVPDNLAPGPIYLATRNNDLQDIIDKTLANRREDLVFLQNGVLTKFLAANGLESNTQGLIYFAVSKKGEKPIDGITRLNPDGLTAVTGKWANDFAARLKNAGLTCRVLDKQTWTVAMYEKHIWICAMMAIGAKHKCTVGDVETLHRNEVVDLIEEMMKAITAESGVVFPSGAPDRLCEYAKSVAHFPTALKEFEVTPIHSYEMDKIIMQLFVTHIIWYSYPNLVI